MPIKKNTKTDESSQAVKTNTTPQGSGKGIHVLIVEDDIFLSNIYKTKFEMEGFKVSVSDNGEAGLQDVQKKKPDIVMLDILLPKMDGFVVLEHLKSDKATKDIPVILLTNLGQKDDVEKGLQLGAADYLIKAHFKPSETVSKIRAVLKQKPKR